MPEHDPESGETYQVECSCGWSIQRDARAANLPRENNKRLVRKVAEAHESRPRFGDRSEEEHKIPDVTEDIYVE